MLHCKILSIKNLHLQRQRCLLHEHVVGLRQLQMFCRSSQTYSFCWFESSKWNHVWREARPSARISWVTSRSGHETTCFTQVSHRVTGLLMADTQTSCCARRSALWKALFCSPEIQIFRPFRGDPPGEELWSGSETGPGPPAGVGVPESEAERWDLPASCGNNKHDVSKVSFREMTQRRTPQNKITVINKCHKVDQWFFFEMMPNWTFIILTL